MCDVHSLLTVGPGTQLLVLVVIVVAIVEWTYVRFDTTPDQ